LKFTRAATESMAINQTTGPKIVMSTSGMCEAGRIKHHLKQYISDPRNVILFVGYQAPATLGQVIQSGENPVRIHGKMFPVKAQIANVVGMSAHGDKEDLFRWLSKFKKPAKKLFLTHGEAEACNSLREEITSRIGWETVTPDIGHSFTLD
jgi:metallo-beta-lactamase family protein